MMTNNTIEELGEPYGDLEESYTENTMRTVNFDDVPSQKDNKMSIDGVESSNPYPLAAGKMSNRRSYPRF